MAGDSIKNFQDMVRRIGRYPEDAFLFVRDGLGHAAKLVHGEETESHQALYKYLADKELDWEQLIAQYESGDLPRALVKAIEAAGGCDKLNRHISGSELCWGLRDYALRRWGLLARTVLTSWGIQSTGDFGRIVFGFIEAQLMQKRDDDRLEDFDEVFDFDEAFNGVIEPDGEVDD